MKELREFKIHPHLLRDVIERQAGSIEKATLEGVMNSIEADATTIEVTLDLNRLVIKDNGRGFQLQDEIEQFFETFGTPHTESERKVWAEFRMGRGQLFSFGRNTWRTGTFRMSIDIRNMGNELRYELETGLENYPGCEITIELYDPLSDRDIFHTTNEIGNYVKYVDVPVTVNEKTVNTPPSKSKWDKINDDAFIRFSDNGRLAVYNLGVLVCNFSQSKFGVAGTVVSKQRLKVNFARNDIISTCPVWKRIKKILDATGGRRIKKKLALNDAEREALINRFLSGAANPWEYKQTKLFPDITGTVWSINGIARQGFTLWSTAPSFDRAADTLIQQGRCLVFNDSILDAFDVRDNPNELFRKFYFAYNLFKYIDFRTIKATVNLSASEIPPNQYTPTEIVWLTLLKTIYNGITSYVQQRKIKIGLSQTADAWTDGATYITVSRRFLAQHPYVDRHTGRAHARSFIRAAQVLAHEICHDGEDCLTSLHGPEFDQAYRKLDAALANGAASGMAVVTPKFLERAMKRAKETWRKNQGRGTTPEQAEAALAAMLSKFEEESND